MFSKNKEPKNFSEKMSQRVSKLATPDIPLWIDQALSETNRSLSGYLKNPTQEDLEEMLLGAEAVHCLVSELHSRSVL